jgi:sulfur-oxidizing protein SoxX
MAPAARSLRFVFAAASIVAAQSVQAQDIAGLKTFVIDGDAIPAPLADAPADAARGRAIVVNRQLGLCLLCHSGPFADEPSQGTLAPNLAGAGSRWSEGQLRLRIADARRVNPLTLMPSMYRVDGMTRVAAAWQGRPILTGQQIEDVVAFLRTLRD